MRPVASFFKVAAINAAILLSLLALLVIVMPMAQDLRDHYRKSTPAGQVHHDKRPGLEPYKGESWATDHFAEMRTLRAAYQDFTGWRRLAFDGKTINIDANGYRRTSGLAETPKQAKVWLFGGSTAWGTGSRDDQTIAAYIEKASGLPTFNFGELGYVAHQSLNLLMKLYVEGGRPEYVIFYDGVNEGEKCREELGFFSTSQELEIRRKVELLRSGGSRTAIVFKPLQNIIAQTFGSAADLPPAYNCDTDGNKTDLIVKTLLSDWTIARSIVESHGGKFIAVLQPVAYVGSPTTSYLPDLDASQRKQYAVLYPRIEAALAEASFPYLNLTRIFDGDRKVYVDFCHVIPAGNEMIAERIAKLLR